ncbi:MAG: homoserine O-acetyltransferase [Acidobacteriota bacterium]|nr:homoserine O-acetyltransferase [Acidobacteriota bacterium]
MTEDTFQSSDSVRSGRPLKHVQTFPIDGPLPLEMGGELHGVVVAYETYGELNAARDNAILVCHAISGDSHVARHDGDDGDEPGWWDLVVGPGKAIDTDRYFVICSNVLGGCRGTTGPGSVNPATGRRYGADFPTVTEGDMVEVERRLVDGLGIDRLLAVVGGSMGGHQALLWATRFPDRLRGVVTLATSTRLTTQALAFDIVGRNAIRRDPDFKGGRYLDEDTAPAVGLALARMLGHITYLSPEGMRAKFGANRLSPREMDTEFEKQFSVGSYLAHQGNKFVERFDANSYIRLSLAMDLFDLGDTPEKIAANLRPASCRWLVISFTSDWLFPPSQSQDLVRALVALGQPVSYCNVVSSCGHDAFLLPDELPVYGGLIGAFLENVTDDSPKAVEDDDLYVLSPESIFGALRRPRIDYDQIGRLIEPGASVLDLGCGRGSFLAKLRQDRARKLLGLDIHEGNILYCLQRGLDAVQADLNSGLGTFPDGRFDYVVLSQTLQSVRDVEQLVREMLRVGRRSVVSFPNFAYYKLREMLLGEGRSPVSSGILRHEWYNTPNIRFFSITDFEDFCAKRGITVHERLALDTEMGRLVEEDANRLADMAIFVISK